MSRRWVVAIAVVLFGILAAASPVLPQTPPTSRAELGRKIEDIRPRLDEANRAAQRAEAILQDSVRAANQRAQDTVRLGPFRIVTVEGQGELAREFFQPQVDRVAPMIQGSEALFRNHTWTFFYGWRRTRIYSDDAYVYEVSLNRQHSLGSLENEAQTALGRGLYATLPADAGGLAQLASAATFLPPDDWSWVYRELAGAPNLAAKECFDGNLPWCWEALGVNDVQGGGLDWDSPAERRRLVESRYEEYLAQGRPILVYSRFGGPPHREGERLTQLGILLRGCLVLDLDRACDLVLEGYHRPGLRTGKDYGLPLSGAARGTLVGEALALGGPGSFTRLLSRPQDPLRDRLAYAAGVPAETLIARWREQVLESKPNAQAGLLLSPLSLLFWLVLLVALATRSTRWRLG
jgi:hypothetical protein